MLLLGPDVVESAVELACKVKYVAHVKARCMSNSVICVTLLEEDRTALMSRRCPALERCPNAAPAAIDAAAH